MYQKKKKKNSNGPFDPNESLVAENGNFGGMTLQCNAKVYGQREKERHHLVAKHKNLCDITICMITVSSGTLIRS